LEDLGLELRAEGEGLAEVGAARDPELDGRGEAAAGAALGAVDLEEDAVVLDPVDGPADDLADGDLHRGGRLARGREAGRAEAHAGAGGDRGLDGGREADPVGIDAHDADTDAGADGDVHGPVGGAKVDRLDEPLLPAVEVDEDRVLPDLDDDAVDRLADLGSALAGRPPGRLFEEGGEGLSRAVGAHDRAFLPPSPVPVAPAGSRGGLPWTRR